MRHRVKGRKLGRTSSHYASTMRQLVTAILEHKRIHTTEAKAKELRPLVEKVITKARKAYMKEQQGTLPDGMKYDVHTRRLLAKDIVKKTVIENLFDEILPEIGDRQGGFTRIVKTGFRLGDGGSKALIELVDFNKEQTGPTSLSGKKKKVVTKAAKPVVKEEAVVVAEEEVFNDEIVDVAEEVEVIETENNETNESTNTEDIVAENTSDEVIDAPAEITAKEDATEEINNENPDSEENKTDESKS